MNRLLFAMVVLGCWTLLGGCAQTPPKPIQHYTLAGPGSVAATQAQEQSPDVLRIAAVTAPQWLQGTGICYRMTYHSASEVASYADSRWSAPVPSMLGELVQNALSARRAWKAIIGPADNAKADADVRIHLLDLCQNFQAPDQSTVTLDARVTVVATGDGRVLAQHEFRIRRPAPSPDAPGGVTAARAAARHFAGALTDWIAGLQLNSTH